MSERSIFFEEWIRCLREHYMQVIRQQDKLTEQSLVKVMLETGFSESELAELRLRATMHIDDVGEDFVPDLNILETASPTFQPHPAECSCPQCIPVDESRHDSEGQPLPPEQIDPQQAEHPDKKPRQLDLFG